MDNWDSFKKVADRFNIESLVGKEYTWKLERFHLTIRTALSRFVRRGIRYSKIQSARKSYYIFSGKHTHAIKKEDDMNI